MGRRRISTAFGVYGRDRLKKIVRLSETCSVCFELYEYTRPFCKIRILKHAPPWTPADREIGIPNAQISALIVRIENIVEL